MIRMVFIASVAAAAMSTASASSAADLRVSSQTIASVHIAVAGKSIDQIKSEIDAAAVTVCGQKDMPCVDAATSAGYDQLAAITRSHLPQATSHDVDIAEIDATTIRVPTAGKSLAVIHADIQTAARAVCTAAGGADGATCVKAAVADAQSQLDEMARNETGHLVASN
jgi:hypothetical protein